MDKPCLVIMAAGMGSRYGGLKQLDKVDAAGHIIMAFSLYDAHAAGFERVIFIIKPSIEKLFKETVGARAEKYMQVEYAYQTVDDLPTGLLQSSTRTITTENRRSKINTTFFPVLMKTTNTAFA